MKIFVKAKTGQREAGVEKISDNTFVVKVRQLPERGEANAAIVETLAKYLGIPKTSLRIISGQTSKTKLLEILK